MKTVENIAKEAIKVHVIDVKITWVSNYGYPITKSSNQTPVIGHPRDRVMISNSNWTEWSTIQGVIARVISKSGEREA